MRFEAVGRGSEHSVLVLKILNGLGYNKVSRKLLAHSDELHLQRLKGFLDDQLPQPDDEDDNLNLPSVPTDLWKDGAPKTIIMLPIYLIICWASSRTVLYCTLNGSRQRNGATAACAKMLCRAETGMGALFRMCDYRAK